MISNFCKSNRTVGGSWAAKINNNLISVFYELHYVKLDLVIYQITSFERVVELVLTSLFISVWLLSFSGT